MIRITDSLDQSDIAYERIEVEDLVVSVPPSRSFLDSVHFIDSKIGSIANDFTTKNLSLINTSIKGSFLRNVLGLKNIAIVENSMINYEDLKNAKELEELVIEQGKVDFKDISENQEIKVLWVSKSKIKNFEYIKKLKNLNDVKLLENQYDLDRIQVKEILLTLEKRGCETSLRK